MELYRDILCHLLQTEEFEIFLPKWNVSAEELLHTKCYQALQAIKQVLEDDSLNDRDCFERIERIICIFEELGSGIADRHDFG